MKKLDSTLLANKQMMKPIQAAWGKSNMPLMALLRVCLDFL